VEPEIRHHDELRRVDRVPNRVPEDLALTLGSEVELAAIGVELQDVERAEMADEEQEVVGRRHVDRCARSEAASAYPFGTRK